MSSWLTFLLSAVAISLTGVMGPGPVTAAALAAGARHRHAGFMTAIGHDGVELPLVLLIVIGLDRFFLIGGVKTRIGLAVGLLVQPQSADVRRSPPAIQNPTCVISPCSPSGASPSSPPPRLNRTKAASPVAKVRPSRRFNRWTSRCRQQAGVTAGPATRHPLTDGERKSWLPSATIPDGGEETATTSECSKSLG